MLTFLVSLFLGGNGGDISRSMPFYQVSPLRWASSS